MERTRSKPLYTIRQERAESASATGSTQQEQQLPRPSSFVFVGQNDLRDRTSRRKSRKSSTSSGQTTAAPSDNSFDPSGGNANATKSSLSWLWDPTISPASPLSSALSLSAPSSTGNTPPAGGDDDDDSRDFGLSLSSQIGRHPGDVEYALSFYHSCFSHITLTYAVQVNPWQAVLPHIQDDIPCVRDAAVALSQRQQAHLHRRPEGASVLRLKARALSMFASHLPTLSLESGISTSLLLIALDYAESGLSNWTIHLRGAFRILEHNGGIGVAESRPQLRSQIAMLIWYDVTAALISRCGPIFPRRYLEALMMWQSEREWSVLALNGLPDGMFLDMHDLAVVAAHPETMAAETIWELETRISNAQVNDRGNKQLALMSLAWRTALLLYLARISRHPRPTLQTQMASPSPSASNPHRLALEILEIVAKIPSHSNFQKQCLMPVILAACELTSADCRHRKFVVDYGELWKQKTGIWIFDSGLEFMRGVWARDDGDKANQQGRCSLKPQRDDDPDGVEVTGECIAIPWTEIFPHGVEYGFLFG